MSISSFLDILIAFAYLEVPLYSLCCPMRTFVISTRYDETDALRKNVVFYDFNDLRPLKPPSRRTIAATAFSFCTEKRK